MRSTQLEHGVGNLALLDASTVEHPQDRVRMREEVGNSLAKVTRLRKQQGNMLEAVASRELRVRRDRLETYQNKARFAFADSYDRASKQRSK